jgi:hypothetical protein
MKITRALSAKISWSACGWGGEPARGTDSHRNGSERQREPGRQRAKASIAGAQLQTRRTFCKTETIHPASSRMSATLRLRIAKF